MTPLQLAKLECANFNAGNCLNIDINNDLTLRHGNFSNNQCSLADGKRCVYFEECVAPMAEYQTDSRKAKSYQEAVFDYRMKHPEMGMATSRSCPDCGPTYVEEVWIGEGAELSGNLKWHFVPMTHCPLGQIGITGGYFPVWQKASEYRLATQDEVILRVQQEGRKT